jgi:hypothetical protein
MKGRLKRSHLVSGLPCRNASVGFFVIDVRASNSGNNYFFPAYTNRSILQYLAETNGRWVATFRVKTMGNVAQSRFYHRSPVWQLSARSLAAV